jgi:trehalose 6-phosphate synthase
MEPTEVQMRMHRMRELIREHNIYQWAGNLITELCEIRLNAEDGEGKFRVHASAV